MSVSNHALLVEGSKEGANIRRENMKTTFIGSLIVAGLVTISVLAQQTSFNNINLTATTLATDPLSLQIEDLPSLHKLTDAQLAAVVQALDGTPTMAPADLPNEGKFATYFSLQHPEWPPLPGNLNQQSVWPMANFYLLNDVGFDYDAPVKKTGGQMRTMSFSLDPGDAGDDSDTNIYTANSYSSIIDTNGLWIELLNVDTTNQLANLLLHNTSETNNYELLSATNLLQSPWTFGTYKAGDSGTNQTTFYGESIADNSMMFFRAQQSDWRVEIEAQQNAIKAYGNMPGQNGIIYLYGFLAGSSTNDLTVYYKISGTASNGVDFVNLSGVVTLTNNNPNTTIEIQPLTNNLLGGIETLTLTLVATNTYLNYPGNDSATILIYDSSTTMQISGYPDAIEPNGPPGVPAMIGQFTVSRYDFRGNYTNSMAAKYLISGTASNGVDYASLSGTIHFAPDYRSTNIDIVPLADNLPEGVETVVLTLAPTNTYRFDDPPQDTAAISIFDSSTTVSIVKRNNAKEPGQNTNNSPGYAGLFTIFRSDARDIYTNNLTVWYSISGTAINGVDYATLSGAAIILSGEISTDLFVQPLADLIFEDDETVTLTLLQTNGCMVDTNQASATITIQDTTSFLTVTNISQPVGMDYCGPSNSLIVSSLTAGGFVRIYTNGVSSNTIVNAWSTISGLLEEAKLATVKTTANGFTNGDMYFGNNAVTKIGWLSANCTTSNLNWATLTNDTYIRGGLYLDQSGSFGGDLIAVTGNAQTGTNAGGGVWRIKSSGVTTHIVTITNTHLEGVITLTNDPAKWGPWAGKIITGAESKSPPEIYAISTNGTYATFQLGIEPEDFDLIPTNQDLYCTVESGPPGVAKLSRSYFAPYVGDLLVTQSGDAFVGATPILFIVHWDNGTSSFVVRSIPGPSGKFEHVSFAPINLPAY